MRKNDKLTKLIFDRQLVSVMNQTKWREFASAMTANPAFTPTARVTYIDGCVSSFSYLDWECIRLGENRMFERIDLDPIKREYAGRLIGQTETDFSEWIKQALNQHSIPFEEIDGLFRINGYLCPTAA
jgi:hypothetical protein